MIHVTASALGLFQRTKLDVRFSAAMAFGLLCVGELLLALNHVAGESNLVLFVWLYVAMFAIATPQRILSPLGIFYVYYGLFYVVPALFAERYPPEILSLPEYTLAFLLIHAVFGTGVIALLLGESWGMRFKQTMRPAAWTIQGLTRLIVVLYVVATLMVVAIVMSSGGFATWIADPGEAFLNRSGSGVFVILSHFSSEALAGLVGFLAYKSRRKTPVLLFIFWVLLTSPVHGSKLQIATLLILVLLPWVKDVPVFSPWSFLIGTVLSLVFFLGLYFRNSSWIDLGTLVPYALNYFTPLENLAISLRDFRPDFLTTFFLPFVKFQTPFGLSEASLYFDMNHMLTDIYYPHAWEIRATEQWPVETDLYLNFFFLFGLPLVALYLVIIGFVQGYARATESLGAWLAAIMLTLFMVSHLRGSLINHTDFYMYPYIFFIFLVFSRYRLTTETK